MGAAGFSVIKQGKNYFKGCATIFHNDLNFLAPPYFFTIVLILS